MEEILAGRNFGGFVGFVKNPPNYLRRRKFGGIGRNLIWRMQRNVNFGGWRELNLADIISTKLNMINAFL